MEKSLTNGSRPKIQTLPASLARIGRASTRTHERVVERRQTMADSTPGRAPRPPGSWFND